ncbi:hypothetical protein M405DRAFT_921526 [Rhizopogon salebrosus TDB-379]|nr:hypothetical protein M405DRAFT_921526 [Rhizopogon salebrosus TDB-379]
MHGVLYGSLRTHRASLHYKYAFGPVSEIPSFPSCPRSTQIIIQTSMSTEVEINVSRSNWDAFRHLPDATQSHASKGILRDVKEYLKHINPNLVTMNKGKGMWSAWHGDGKSSTRIMNKEGSAFQTRSIESTDGKKFMTMVAPKGTSDWQIKYTSATWDKSPKTIIAALLKALERY